MRPAVNIGWVTCGTKLHASHTYLGIRRNEVLFCGANIRPPLQQRRCQAGWYLRWEQVLVEPALAADRARILSQQKTDLVLRLLSLLLKRRDNFGGSMNKFLGLPQIQAGCDAAALARLHKLQGDSPRLQRSPGDFQFVIQLAQSDIRRSDVAHQRRDDSLPRFFITQKIGSLVNCRSPLAPTCGNWSDRVIPRFARAASTRATASRRS